MTKLKCYIAGPMRGIDDYNFPAFFIAEAWLTLKGHDVISPARMDIEAGKAYWSDSDSAVVCAPSFTFPDAMRRDISAIARDRDSIVLLPGWRKSKGATEELKAAKLFGLDIYEYVGDGEVKPLEES